MQSVQERRGEDVGPLLSAGPRMGGALPPLAWRSVLPPAVSRPPYPQNRPQQQRLGRVNTIPQAGFPKLVHVLAAVLEALAPDNQVSQGEFSGFKILSHLLTTGTIFHTRYNRKYQKNAEINCPFEKTSPVTR